MVYLRACPEDRSELAELYLMHRLQVDEERQAEEHFLICSACMEVLEETEAFINAVRAVNRPVSEELIFVPASASGSTAQWSAVPPSENT